MMDILHGLVTGNVWVWTGLISVVVVLLVAVVLLALVWIQLNQECDLRGFEGLDYEGDGKNTNHADGDRGHRTRNPHGSRPERYRGSLPMAPKQRGGPGRVGRA